MSTSIDQKAYLQKYLGGPSKDKKKKKKKTVKGKGFKIIDDDLDLTKLRPLDGDELDILDGGEDAPQIAGIIDERPEELRKLEQFQTSSKWRVINQDDGFNSNLQIEEIKKDIKETEKENEVIFGKMYSDSEDEKQKNDSDLSPPRKNSSKKHDNDSDFSPPRKREQSPKRKETKHNSREQSPKRKKTKRDLREHSPKRKETKRDSREQSPKRKETRYDSDVSPPRKQEARKERKKPSRWGDADPESTSNSPKRNELKARSQSSDLSPPRKNKNYDSDESPSRKRKMFHNNDRSRKARSSSDLSPPRKNDRRKSVSPKRTSKKSPERYSKTDRESSKRDKDRRELSDRNRNMSERDKKTTDKRSSTLKNNKRKYSSDSDLSPPRKGKDLGNNNRKNDSDSDLSPPRRGRDRNIEGRDRNTTDRDRNMLDRDRNKLRRGSDSPPPTNKKMAKTLEGKMAGLQDARQLREENEEFRRKENDVFKKLGDDVSGRNAQAVKRKGKRDTSEDRQKQKEKAERQKELDAKYQKWTKGLKQIEAQEARIQDYMHEASKPLARHKGDRDLEHSLKQVERAGDPMLQYIRERKRDRGELPPERPSYKGSFPPNRFNIRPGYRWDGVDRSNGYETKYFDQQSKRKAQEEQAYKWSTEDL